MSNEFDLIFCKDDEENYALVVCLTPGTKIVIDSLFVGIEWTRSEDLYDVACISREEAMGVVAEAVNAGLRVGFGEITNIEVVPVRMH